MCTKVLATAVVFVHTHTHTDCESSHLLALQVYVYTGTSSTIVPNESLNNYISRNYILQVVLFYFIGFINVPAVLHAIASIAMSI